MRTRVFVSLDNNPSRCIRNTKVKNLASSNQSIESMHNLLNTGSEIPPMHVEQVDVIRTHLLQRTVYRDMHRLEGVADKVGLKGLCITSMAAVSGRVFGGNDHLVAVSFLLHPFADPFFGFFALVCVCSIDEITTEIEEGVENLETGGLVAFSHD